MLYEVITANVVIDGKVCGYISKLHPTVQEAYDIPVTFIAELDFEALMPEHINAKPISRFQGAYKDLSVVIEKKTSYFEVAKLIRSLELPLLKDAYPVDIYQDEKLGDKKSLTIRFFIQSMEDTLKDTDTEAVVVITSYSIHYTKLYDLQVLEYIRQMLLLTGQSQNKDE